MDHRPCAACQDGFTIIEVMVASLVLIVGVLGVLAMLTGALNKTALNNERIGATNLARELVERTRGLDFDNLNVVTSQLQTVGLGSGSPWTIQRRGVTYTVTATTCAFDDPSDGYAATAPANACNTNAAGADTNGDDFRRVTFQLAWQDAGKMRSMSQTTLIVNPSGGLGPRIVTITPVTQTITDAAVNTVNIDWTTTLALTLRWDADDGVSGGSITAATPSGATSFRTAWNIGISGSRSEVLDGSYTVTGQPFDERDIAGEAKRADVVLNRRQAYAPSSLRGGHDTRVNDWVDFDWPLNRERDILGYRVVWAGPDGIVGNGNDQQVCPASGAMLPPKTVSCADFSPTAGAQTYYVVAVDRDAANGLRDGDKQILNVGAAGTRPDAPTAPAIAPTTDGKAHLSWSAPAAAGVAFYRIYRGGTSYSDRYDRTNGAATTFTDDDPGTISRDYWVTAVDGNYNESDPVGRATWTP